MMNNDLWKDNQFISFLYDYYFDIIENPIHHILYTKKEKRKYKYIPFIKEEYIETFDDTQYDLDRKKNVFISTEFQSFDYSLTFDQLWKFCQFVRYAEKVIFYKNDTNCKLYVDSKLDEKYKMKFSLNLFDDVSSIFELERIKERDKYLEVINITINREYGKQMMDRFVIVDRDVKYNDSSDILLMNTINRELRQSVIDTFLCIINDIETKIGKNKNE